MPDEHVVFKPSTKVNAILKHLGQSFFIAIVGFLLVNISFMLDLLWHNSVTFAMFQLTGLDPNDTYAWYPVVLKISFLLMIVLIAYFLYLSRLGTLIKASFTAIPVATLLLTIGLSMSGSSTYAVLSCLVVLAGIVTWLIRHRIPWQYSFSALLAGLGSLALLLSEI